MRIATCLVGLLCASLSGCAQIQDAFRGSFQEPVAGYSYFFPQPSIVQVSASPEEVVYEYSRIYGDEFPHAVTAAEKFCKNYDKRAQVVSLIAKDKDRSWATFVCR